MKNFLISVSLVCMLLVVWFPHATAQAIRNLPLFASLPDVNILSPTAGQTVAFDANGKLINVNAATINVPAGADIFFDDTASDVSTYQTLAFAPENVTETDISATANNNRVLIKAYASASGGLGVTSISAGAWDFTQWGYVDATGVGTSSFDLDVMKRTSGGTETLLFNVNTGTILSLAGSIDDYTTSTIQQAFTINATDRLVVKVYCKTTSIVNRTCHTTYGGSTHYSYMSTPLYTISPSEYIGTGTGNFVRATSATLVTPNIGAASGASLTLSSPGTSSTDVPTLASTSTLTNKTLTAPVIATISNSGTITFPTGTDTLLARATTDTLTNKRITKRVVTASDATSVTPNSDNADITYQLNTQGTGTLTVNADGGTPTNEQNWEFKIKSTNVQTFSWNSIFVGGTTALPTTSTGGSKIDRYLFRYDTVNTKWQFVSSALGY